jgi:hypothetical protein
VLKERMLIVLPDPLPEQPVKRYPEPSRAELQEKVDAIDAEVQTCFDRLKSTRDFFEQRTKIREAARPAFEQAKGAVTKLNGELKAMFDKKKEITAKIRAIKDADFPSGGAERGESGAGGGKDATSVMRGLRTLEDVNAKIRELEAEQSSKSMSLPEEKKLVAQISFLNNSGRDLIASKDKAFKDERAAKEARVAERKTLEEERKAVDAQIDAKKAQAEERRKAFDVVLAKQGKAIKAIANVSQDVDRDAEKAKITERKAQMRALREKYQKDHEAWFLNERISQEQAKVLKRKRLEAQLAERDAKRKEWEEEQAQYPVADPYQPEKDVCAALVHLLQTLMGTAPGEDDRRIKADSTTSSLLPAVDGPTLCPKKEAREVTGAGGKAIGKATAAGAAGFEDQAYGAFAVERSGSKKSRRARRVTDSAAAAGSPGAAPAADGGKEAEEDVKLRGLSIEHLQYFAVLEIAAPNWRSDLKPTLAAVQAKKAYFDDDPPAKDEVAAAKAARAAKADAATASSAKKSARPAPPGAADAAMAFPGLGNTTDAPAAAVAAAASRPSFLSVAGGKAAPPGAEATPAEVAGEAEGATETARESSAAPAHAAVDAAAMAVPAAMNGGPTPTSVATAAPVVEQKTAASVVRGAAPAAARPAVPAGP